jgi:transcriptional regulator with XRE-family HTH domain
MNKEAIINKIASNLKQLRTSRGYCTQEVAEAMDIDESKYSAMETNVSDCDIQLIVQLAELYEVPLEKILPDNLRI